MKAWLPYFFLALLSGCFFFPGSVQAAIFSEDFRNHSKDLVSTLPNQHQAEMTFRGLYCRKNADQGLTYKRGGSGEELPAVNAQPAGGVAWAVIISGVDAAESPAFNTPGFGAGFRGNDAEETVTADSQTRGPGENLRRKLVASFFYSFL